MNDNSTINEHLKRLPEVVQYKILNYYLIIHSKQKNIRWPDSSSRIRDFNLYCQLYDKLNNNGYVKLEVSSLKLIEKKFPNIKLNPKIEKDHLKKMLIDCWNKLYKIAELNIWPGVLPAKRNLLLAGGYFSQYVMNAFSREFSHYHSYFSFNQDYDIFFNGLLSKSNSYKKYYLLIKGYQNRFNIIIGSNNRSTEVVDKFDMDCCKIFYSFEENQLYAHNSLMFNNCSIKLPSFFDINMDQLKSSIAKSNRTIATLKNSQTEMCVCTKFKRVLKYMMKGFYDPTNVENELQRAHEIEDILVKKQEYECVCNICASKWDLQEGDAEIYDLTETDDTDTYVSAESDGSDSSDI